MNDGALKLLLKHLREDVDRNTDHRLSAHVDWGAVISILALIVWMTFAAIGDQKRDSRLDAIEAAVERLEADR